VHADNVRQLTLVLDVEPRAHESIEGHSLGSAIVRNMDVVDI
jgi:hypothetical protein